MPITPFPPAPSRADPATFADKADAYLSHLESPFVAEANALQTNVNAKEAAVNASATAAAASATAAANTANVAAWVSGTTYAVGVNRYDTTDFLTYRRKTAGAGTTRPGLDPTNWQLLTGLGDISSLSLAAPTGSALVGFQQAGAGAVPRTLQDKNQEQYATTDYGVPTDGSDAYPKLQALLTYVGIAGGGRVRVNAGTYLVSQELKVPSNVTVAGDGIELTIIRAHNSLPADQNVITNAKNDRLPRSDYDRGIHVKDMTVDGNWQGRVHGAASNDQGACLKFSTVMDSSIEKVKAINGVLHCIDVAASIYDGGSTVQPAGPSLRVKVRDCIALNPKKDDAFTTHNSGFITVKDCYAEFDRATYGEPLFNQQGFEADDGSFHVKFVDCESVGFTKAYQAKGHATAKAAQHTRFVRCYAKDCAFGFDMAHDTGTAATSGIGFSVVDCTVENPIPHSYYTTPYTLSVNNAQVVNVRNFTVINPGISAISLSNPGASIINVDGVTFLGAAATDPIRGEQLGLIHLFSSIAGARVSITNVTSDTAQPRSAIVNSNADVTLDVQNVFVDGSDSSVALMRISDTRNTNLAFSGLAGSGWSGLVYDGVFTATYSNHIRQHFGRDKRMTIESGSPEGIVFAPRGTVLIGRASGLQYRKDTEGNLNTGWISVA